MRFQPHGVHRKLNTESMFEDAKDYVALKGSLAQGEHHIQQGLFLRCTADSTSSIIDTMVPTVCYDRRGCCNTAKESAVAGSAALDQPVSSKTTLDANALITPARINE